MQSYGYDVPNRGTGKGETTFYLLNYAGHNLNVTLQIQLSPLGPFMLGLPEVSANQN